MKLLEDKILKEGTVLPGDILKVGSFLNHQIDVPFLMELAKEAKKLFAGEEITKVLTVEASGIAVATAVASVLNVPLVFAKKHASANISPDVYSSKVHSYTHGNDYNMVVEAQYLSAEDKLLIVDDFLASGEAFGGLIEIARKSGAKITGLLAVIEKVYQGGGNMLREKGYRVESFAKIKSMSDSSLVFCD